MSDGRTLDQVAIFCDAGSHQKWWLASIALTYGGRAIPLSAPQVGDDRLVDRSQIARRDGMHPGWIYLVDDEVAESDTRGGQVRSRWSLTCERCGDSLAVRDERLESMLRTLIDHGITEVSLRGLRAAAMGS